MTRVLSIALPHLPTDRLRRAGIGPAEGPLVTVLALKGAQRLAGIDPAAFRLGLRTGMGLADARAMHPTLAAVPGDLAAEAAFVAGIADWCRRFTPLAALDPPDGVVLDITGAAHLFGGEAAMLTDTLARLANQGLHARGAVADTPEAAWAFARHGAHGVLPPADDPGFVRLAHDLPLAGLRLSPALCGALAQAGLRRVGDVALRPRAPIAARFGKSLLMRIDALMGRVKNAIQPRFDAPAFVAERRFVEGVARREDIEGTLQALARDLATLMERRGEGARRLVATLFRIDGAVREVEVGTSRPLREPEPMARLFRERLDALGEDGLDTGYGFDVVRLAATLTERLDPTQVDGVDTPSRAAGLADLVDRLGARLGPARVARLAVADAHVPERALAHRPASATGSSCLALPDAHPELERPMRLFARPEPIEAMAAVPDGPPLRFRWRRVMHEVAAVEGPERIAGEWWRGGPTPPTRDYFRAEDREGQRFWLFREGLYVDREPLPRWYVHGLFG